ncbi:hypothetical protein KJS94_12960 [Flavihumibacter rivuli]|uniref:hypothetical protein n=1 Tax=Flavihumibacter rivuli TaxID=2838156 RepID=UPI001BDEF3E6|nr:hypothetical protein [Flavihumibacter rivuli]ULQ55555.1 hypothetical protein KJS94_12960 [Flavihumibacter rivuli]
MKRITMFFAVLLVLASACGPSTKVTKSWRDPGSTVNFDALKKVLVISLVQNETSRRVVEDALAARLKGKGVASYTLNNLPSSKESEDAVINALKAQGFDAVVVTRLVDIEKETSYVPGTTYPSYYGRFGGYYGYAYGAYGSPGYYTEDKVYSVETNIYTLNPDKLVYSCVTQTTNPSKLEKTINEIAQIVHDRMVQDGLIAK